jgi:hypothetical protein
LGPREIARDMTIPEEPYLHTQNAKVGRERLLAALELHPFLHRVPKIDTPTHVVFDLGSRRRAPTFSTVLRSLLVARCLDETTIWILDAHRDDGKRFVVRAEEKLTASLELESALRAYGELI